MEYLVQNKFYYLDKEPWSGLMLMKEQILGYR